MWGVGINTSVSNNEQVSNVYNEAQKYTDQSVKDTMIQNYITQITTRNEDVNELVKNFINNVSADADSVQRNTLEFAACLDLSDVVIKQKNELEQNAKQGFQKLNEDAKTLKRVLESESETGTTSDQGSTNTQGATSESEQEAKQEQESTQEVEQQAGFTALNAYNKYLMKERYVSSIKPRTKHLGIREYFDTFRCTKDAFCLFACLDVNTAVQNSSQISNSSNIDLQTNIQTQDIYKKIETAYDKTVETITKISETINETTNSMATAKSVQINEVRFDEKTACLLKLQKLDVTQTNKLKQNVELTTAIESINSLTTDNEIKAIMLDMMGLTQSSDTKQDTASKSTQKSSQEQKNEQTTKQTAGTGAGGAIAVLIILAVLGCVGFLIYKSYGGFDEYFDGPLTKK